MKVKVLNRDPQKYTRKTKHDIHPLQTNVDPKLHPFEAAREYKRALNAGHRDGVHCVTIHPKKLSVILSGSYDGEVRAWNLGTRRCLYSATLHDGFVRGLCVTPSAEHFISVGQDKNINIARMDQIGVDVAADDETIEAPMRIVGNTIFTGVDHHHRQEMFATSGRVVELWSPQRSEPMRDITWGVDTVNTIKFNKVEVNVLATTGDDRSITLYDVRAASPIKQIIMDMRSNRLCWNPMEAFNFTVANENHNLYSYDMRRMDRAMVVHKDHVSAVMDVAYSPTGKEFVSASYDCTLRIFPFDKGHSREVYHTKRMQRVFTVAWTADNKYIVSGSDEMNLRLWKSTASERLGAKAARQLSAIKYQETVKNRFIHHPEIRRISRHRRLPKAIFKARAQKHAIQTSETRKEENRRRHAKPGAIGYKNERKKAIVEVKE